MQQITFSGAPTRAQGAALYSYALKVKQEVDAAADEFIRQDNSARDLCDTPGTVVLERYQGLSGSLIGRNLDATELSQKPSIDEFGDRTTYEFVTKLKRQETADGDLYSRSFGRSFTNNPVTTVLMNANGSVSITAPSDLSTGQEEWVGVDARQVTNFAATGPADASTVGVWAQAQKLRATIDQEMSELKHWDQTGQDLNPTPGIAVCADYKGQKVSEKALHFDPSSGENQSYFHHSKNGAFGGSTVSYRREGGEEVYARTAYTGLEEVRVAEDRSITFTEYGGKVTVAQLPAYLKAEAAEAKAAEQLKADIAVYDALPWYKRLFTVNPRPAPVSHSGFGVG